MKKGTKAKTRRPRTQGAYKATKVDFQVVDVLRKALLERKGDWARIVREEKLNYRWLLSFAHGDIAAPTITRFKKLANALGLEVTVTPTVEQNAGATQEPTKE